MDIYFHFQGSYIILKQWHVDNNVENGGRNITNTGCLPTSPPPHVFPLPPHGI